MSYLILGLICANPCEIVGTRSHLGSMRITSRLWSTNVTAITRVYRRCVVSPFRAELRVRHFYMRRERSFVELNVACGRPFPYMQIRSILLLPSTSIGYRTYSLF